MDLKVERRAPLEGTSETYVPAYQHQPGGQLVMVYIGSSRCGYSNLPGLPRAVEDIKLHLKEEAEARGMSVKTVGVAIDWSTSAGMDHLSKFGSFDEVAAGSNWGSDSALRYLWSDEGIPAATPLILLYSRQYTAPADTIQNRYGEQARRTILVLRGSEEIIDWASLPTFPEAPAKWRNSDSHREQQ